MVCVSAALLCILEVVLQHGAVVGMCHLDEFLSLLHVALMAKVGHAVLGDDGVDVVVRVVDMAGEGHDAGDGASLRSGTAGEDSEVGVGSEVGRAADAVHHLRTAYLGAVDVAVEVALDGCVEGADTQAGDDFGAVAYLRRKQNELVLEEVDVVVDGEQALVGDGQRGG